MDEDDDRAGRILDTALMLGERDGWDALHLYELAEAMGLGLEEVHRHYRQKDDLAEAWFDRADRAMLRAGAAAGWRALPARERLSRAILAWLQALAAHRRLTVEMLRYKGQPDHLHLQLRGLLRVSRTVQWLRETACLPAAGWRRELEEAALTAIFLGTLGCWLRDESPDAGRTRAWLARQLARAERIALRFPP